MTAEPSSRTWRDDHEMTEICDQFWQIYTEWIRVINDKQKKSNIKHKIELIIVVTFKGMILKFTYPLYSVIRKHEFTRFAT